MSCRIVVRSFGSAEVTLKLVRIVASNNAEKTNDAESNASTQVRGSQRISAPASRGPATWAAEYDAWIRPFAVTRSSVATRLGIAANSPALNAMKIVDWM